MKNKYVAVCLFFAMAITGSCNSQPDNNRKFNAAEAAPANPIGWPTYKRLQPGLCAWQTL